MLNLNYQYWLELAGVEQQDLSSSALGITNTEAKIRIAKYGKNIIGLVKKNSLILQFLSRFRNSLVTLLLVGTVSSIFDFLTFYVMLNVLNAKAELFRTGWFVELIITQVLVIFIIRTRRNIFKSTPNIWLAFSSLLIVGVAASLPFTSIGAYCGFSPLPPMFFTILLIMGVCYLVMVEFVKHQFYRIYNK